MKIRDLTATDLFSRCCGPGLCWGVGPFTVRIKSRLHRVAEGLAFLYAAFPCYESDSIVDVELSVRRRAPFLPWVRIRVDGAVQHNWLRTSLVVPTIEWTMNVCVFQRPHQFFMLHSAVVESGGCAAILPGEAGSGKSTLCAALVNRGWRLLSDEVALVHPDDGQVWPVPRPISLKEESIEVIRRFAPDAVLGPEWPGTPKGTVAHLLPSTDSVDASSTPAGPRWILFPNYTPQAQASLTRVSKASALMRVANNAFNYSVHGRKGFELLADLIDRCECYEFRFSDLSEAVAEIETLRSPTLEAWTTDV